MRTFEEGAGGHLLVVHVRVERQQRRDLDHRDSKEMSAICREAAGKLHRALGLGVVDERDEETAVAAEHTRPAAAEATLTTVSGSS